ncbi:hypothetical protein X559_1650 [Paenilisteria newyorkensis]|nr:hypothetical protein X559_1650 [Listeria newyorkensis]
MNSDFGELHAVKKIATDRTIKVNAMMAFFILNMPPLILVA